MTLRRDFISLVREAAFTHTRSQLLEGQPITTLRLRARRKSQMTPAAAPKSPEVDLDDSDVDADFRLDVVGSASSSSSMSSEDGASDEEHDTIAMKSQRRGRKTHDKTAQVIFTFK